MNWRGVVDTFRTLLAAAFLDDGSNTGNLLLSAEKLRQLTRRAPARLCASKIALASARAAGAEGGSLRARLDQVGCQQILHYPDFAARSLAGEDNAASVGVNTQVPHAATA